MAGDAFKKKKKGKRDEGFTELQEAALEFQNATKMATDAIAELEAAKAQASAGGGNGEVMAKKKEASQGAGAAEGVGSHGGPQLTGSMSSLDVVFPQNTVPAPAFAGVCLVHKFPEYALIDFGSIDPLNVDDQPDGRKRALLQHVGRIALPDAAARALLARLAEIYGGLPGASH